ncbi:hypothetical protein CTI12_AA251920 [Artemisia annua]|uniref:Uncharacterized protein n=1 Tax=Artemisia annua TaxID=35608 RepID=A0A2U1NLI4_ARTAN|nr:hypothetical protein CTI12_AA251920 [Artemisia annua]
MVAVNSLRDSVSPPRPAKGSGKSKTVPRTNPKAQGPKTSGTQPKRYKKPQTDKTPKGQAPTPPVTTKDTDTSQSCCILGIIIDILQAGSEDLESIFYQRIQDH